jgi:hypothetical protein
MTPYSLSFGPVTIPIPQGQNWVKASGLGMPFIPLAAEPYTQGNDVIWASGVTASYSQDGGIFNLSGAPLDGEQELVVTFYGNELVPTALVPTPNPGSQLDRAITAFLIQNGIGKWAVQNKGDCIIVPADSLEIKTYPNVTVWSHSSQHDPVQTGNEYFQVRITCKFSAAGAKQSANPYAARVARDKIVGTLMAAMMQSSDNSTLDYTAMLITQAGNAMATSGTIEQQANNADMTQFTCLHVYYLGTESRGEPDEAGCDWVEVRSFKITCAPSAIDMTN